MNSGKMLRFESLVSSGRSRGLSNPKLGFLNNCLRLVRSLLPQPCQLCGAEDGTSPFCSPCLADLPWLSRNRCGVCALPLASGAVCGACLKQPPRFDRVDAAFAYRFPVDALIRAYKYGGRLALARGLGELLAQSVAHDADAIVAMPLAPERLAGRGFNQAHEIARVVAAQTGIPLLTSACRKVLDTPPQAALPWQERAKNVRHAFVRRRANGKTDRRRR